MTKDVIIIIGGGIEFDGSLPEIPKFRIAKGIELFKSGIASKIIVSGKWAFLLDKEPVRTEAEAMKEYAVSLGVPGKVVFKQDISTDTVGNAYFCKLNFLEPNNWHNIIVVTSDFHMASTRYIFEKVLGNNDYDMEFVSVGSELSPETFAMLTNQQNKKIEFLKKWFDSITPGDTRVIKEFMYTKHPGYAENPEITKEQWSKALGKN